MVFSIEIKKITNDPEFTSKDLVMYHMECGGGLINLSVETRWVLKCKRCDSAMTVSISGEGSAEIFKTAIDGKERTPDIGVKSFPQITVVRRS